MFEAAELVGSDLSGEELPEGWIATTMGEVAEVVGGGTPKSTDAANFAEAGHPWITPADLSNFGDVYIRRGRRDLSDKGFRTCSATVAPAGTVLMSSRAPIGYLSIAAAPISTNQGFKSFVCREGVVPEFVYFWLRSIRKTLEEMGSGSTFAEISGKRAKEIPFLLAPTAEQRRIVEKLEQVLPQVAHASKRLARVPAILKRFRQSVLAAACSGRLTEDWREERRLEDEWPATKLTDVARGFSYGSAAKSSKTGRVPVLRMGNIRDGRLDWYGLVYTSDEEEIVKYRLAAGDVLFNRTNSPELVGKTAVYRGERDAIYAGYLIRVRCADRLLPDYLNYCLNSPAGRDYCQQVKTDGVSQSNINARKLAAFEFGLPAVDEQREIVRRVEGLFKLADAVEKRLSAATLATERLPQAILAKAFRGELVPTEAELARRENRDYEPAAALLKRVAGAR